MIDFPYSVPFIAETVYGNNESPIFIPRKHTVSTYAAQNRRAKRNKRKR